MGRPTKAEAAIKSAAAFTRWAEKRQRALSRLGYEIEVGRCHCGCGMPTSIACQTHVAEGMVKGLPAIFARGHAKKVPARQYVIDQNGCWIWQGEPTEAGYGRITVEGKVIYAHRYYYEKEYGPIEEGNEIHHKCETPPCVNPVHLDSLTPTAHRRLRGSR